MGKATELIIIIVISFFLSFLFWGENLNAKWWAIDDHEIMMFLGEDGEISLKEIPELLLEKTEVGKWGESSRFRPSYYFLRIIESMIWRNDSSLWYFTRLIISTSLFVSLWHSLKPYLGFWYAGLIPFAMYCYSFWSDIFTRLGPAEIYSVLCFSLFFWGFIKQLEILFNKNNIESFTIKSSSVFLSLGAIICIGSKENFLFLAGLQLLLLLVMYVKKKYNWYLMLSSLMIFIFTGYVYSSIFIALSNTGVDVYSEEISMKDRLLLTYNHIPFVIQYFKIKLLLILTAVFSIIVLYFKGLSKWKHYMLRVGALWIILVSILLIYLSQYFFYNGRWPTEMRYDFPGVIFEIIYLSVVLFLFYISLVEINLSEKFSLSIINVTILITFILMQPLIVINGFKQKSLSNVGRTVDFTTKIDQIVQYCKDNPNQPIIYESYSAWDYEPIVSVDRFLKAHGVANTIYLNMKSYTNENYDGGLERKLADELSSVSINGGILADSAKFNSYRSEYLDNCVECLRLGFSGEDVSESAYYRIW